VNPGYLTDDQLREIIHFTPLVSIDLVIENQAGQILLAQRNNEPAQGYYFVPGGMIRKDETRGQAFQRILLRETGLTGDIFRAVFLGVFEHHYQSNRFGDPAFGTHYVVLGYHLKLDEDPQIVLDDQHSQYRWASRSALMDAGDVHENTKDFFRVLAD
jgi:colanic acid biosynthesis protein WcaH